MSKVNNKLTVVYVSTASLKPDPSNPRRLSKQAYEKLKRGIQEFGLVDPIIARKKDKLVIGGHQRLRVAKDLKLKSVPVVYLSNITDDEVAILNVLLNNPEAQGTWDMAKLASVIAQLESSDVDATATGFSVDELKNILSWSDNVSADVDTIESSYAILIECSDEKEQAHLLNRFLKEGLSCRALLA